MSEVIDADFTEAERAKLLAYVKQHLPAFLHRGATEQHDPVGDVRELLNLEPEDLERVKAVHQCLDERILTFGSALAAGLRNPITSSTRPPETSQTVRGPVDWGATLRRRSVEAGNPTLYVVRPAERIFDTPENQVLAWLLQHLRGAVDKAGAKGADPADEEALGWFTRISALGVQLKRAQRVHWLRGVRPQAPTAEALARLRQARTTFYARHVLQAAESILRWRNPTDEELTDILCQRYFRPEETWRLFEVSVALRLARAFAEQSAKPRRTRLLVGGGRATFARYSLPDGDEVALIYQAWPSLTVSGRRQLVALRHDFRPGPSRPDLFIRRTGELEDAAVLELKATYRPGYLGAGLSQLLGYLAEHPTLWRNNPSGWLVAPASDSFKDAPPALDDQLWVISAETVGDRAVERFG